MEILFEFHDKELLRVEQIHYCKINYLDFHPRISMNILRKMNKIKLRYGIRNIWRISKLANSPRRIIDMFTRDRISGMVVSIQDAKKLLSIDKSMYDYFASPLKENTEIVKEAIKQGNFDALFSLEKNHPLRKTREFAINVLCKDMDYYRFFIKLFETDKELFYICAKRGLMSFHIPYFYSMMSKEVLLLCLPDIKKHNIDKIPEILRNDDEIKRLLE